MTEKSDGWVVTIRVSPPSLSDNTADADRLVNELKLVLKPVIMILIYHY